MLKYIKGCLGEKEIRKMRDYYIGLDLGTGSLGWAVTDREYEIMRAHGKALWGVRLFDSANTAEERRGVPDGKEKA